MAGIKIKYSLIVIGSSAGGLLALSAILKTLPADYPIPIVIVQHRSKDYRDLLEEVLQTKCKIKIRQADEKEPIEGGFVYIAPPDYHLLIENDRTFALSSDQPVSYSRPSIDVLFESAAIVFREELIGIILSGANNDGAAGIEVINKNGGVTIAQVPLEAGYPYMPTAAINTKKINHIWFLADIEKFLLKIITY